MNNYRIIESSLSEIPMVSVAMVTYNHQDFIGEAIESVLMQETTFNVELVIAEDYSTDKTREIVLDYQSRFPDQIKVILQNRNIGAQKNNIALLSNLKGKYVAALEGDDYWADPLKLQKQVDFLEENEEYVIHSGKAQILKDNKLGKTIGDPLSKKTYDIADFYTKNNLVTCTAMFRNISISLSNFEGLVFGDWKLYTLLLSQKSGNLAYVADVIYSVYRIHEGGVMQKITRQHENAEAHIKQIESVNKDVNSKFTKQDTQIINSYCISIFDHQLQKSRYKECIAVLFRNIFLVKYKFPLRNYLGLIKYYKFSI